MKSKLFKHMTLPEMYFIDVDETNKIYFEVSGKKMEFLSYLFTVVQEDTAEVNIIIYSTLKYLSQ